MAISELLEAFEAHPTDHRAFEALVRAVLREEPELGLPILFERLPQWVEEHARSPLIRVIVQLARAQEQPAIADLLHHHLGLFYWQHFGDGQKAEATFRKIQGSPPDPTLLRAFYLEHYVAQRQWRRLEQFLSDKERGGLGEPTEVKRTLGRLALEEGQDERAIGFWQGLRVQLPEDQEARDALETLYEAAGRWHAVVDLLNEDVDRLEPDDPRLIETLRRVVEIYEQRLDAPAKAIAAWQALLDVDSNHIEAMDALATAYENLGRWPDLARILEHKAEALPDVVGKVETRRKLAQLMLNRFASSGEAVRHYEAILALEPFDAEALSELKTLYQQRHDHESFVQLSHRELEALPDNLQEPPLRELCRYASKRLRQTDTPRELWEALLIRAPDDLEALRSLSQIYERGSDYSALAAVLDALCERETESEARMACLEKLALLCQRRLDDPERATKTWEAILTLNPEHSRAHAELRKHFISERHWEGLERYFRHHANLEEWARTLESELKTVEEGSERIMLLLKAARVWSDELGEDRRAVRCLESILDIDADHDEAAAALVTRYDALSMTGRLPRVLDILLERRSGLERRDLLVRKAEVCGEHFNDWHTAMTLLQEAVGCAVPTVGLIERFERVAERLGQWSNFVEVVHGQLEHMDTDEQKTALSRLAEVYDGKLGDKNLAAETYARLTEYAPELDSAWRRRLEIHAALLQWDEVVEVLTTLIDMAESDEERIELQRQLIGVHRIERRDLQSAERILSALVADAPGSIELQHELWSLLLERDAFAEVAGWIERLRDARAAHGAAADELADLDCQRGMMTYLAATDLETLREALDHYEAALSRVPDHGPSVRELESLTADPRLRVRVCERLEVVYRHRGAWRDVADCLEVRLQSAEDGQREALLETLVTLAEERLKSKEVAWSGRLRLVEHRPDDDALRELLRATAVDPDALAQLAHECARLGERSPSPQSSYELRWLSAELYADELDAPEEAITQLALLRTAEPDDDAVLQRLDSLYTRLEDWVPLSEVLATRLELCLDREPRRHIRLRLADLFTDKLAQDEAAIEVLQRAEGEELKHEGVHQRLDELLTRASRWPALLTLLDTLIENEVVDSERGVALRLRAAGLLLDKLEQPIEALERYATLLAHRPGHASIIGILEQLWEMDSHRERVSPLLEDHYSRIDERPRLRQILATRIDANEDSEERYGLHLRLAALYAADEELEQQCEHLGRAFLIRPQDVTLLERIEALTASLGRWPDFAGLLERALPSVAQTSLERAFRERLVTVYSEHHLRPAMAIEHLEALLGNDPDHIDWLKHVVELTRALDNPAALASALERLLGLTRDDEARTIMVELGELHAEALDMRERAIMWWQLASGSGPPDADLLLRLNALLEDNENWQALSEGLERLLECDLDEQTWLLYAKQLATTHEKDLLDHDAAILTWQRIRGRIEDDHESYEALERLLTAEARWPALERLWSDWQGIVETPKWASLQYQRAALYQAKDRLNDNAVALDCFIGLFERVPDHQKGISALSELLRTCEASLLLPVFECLRDALTVRQDWESLWMQYDAFVASPHAVDEQLRPTHLARAALAREHLLDPLREFDALCDALSCQRDDHETLERLEALAELNPLADRLGEFLLELSEGEEALQTRTMLRKIAASILMRRGETERAIGVYHQLLNDTPGEPETLSLLAQAHRITEDWVALNEALGLLIEVHEETAELGALIAERAEIFEEHLQQPEQAFQCFAKLLEDDALMTTAVNGLLRLAMTGIKPYEASLLLSERLAESGQFEALKALWNAELNATEETTARCSICLKIGALSAEDLGDIREGIGWLARALTLSPERDDVLEALESLAASGDEWLMLTDSLEECASQCVADERRHMLRERAAAVAREKLEDCGRSERLLRAILDESPMRRGTLIALDQVLEDTEQHGALTEVLRQRLSLTNEQPEVRTLLHRLGALEWHTIDFEGWDWFESEAAINQPATVNSTGLERTTEVYEQLAGLDEGDALAIKRLEQLKAALGAWKEVLNLCRRRALLADSEGERIACLERALCASRDHLDDPSTCIELNREILSIRPSSIPHLRSLQTLFRDSDDNEALYASLSDELPWVADDVARQTELYQTMAALNEGVLARPDEAVCCWEQIVSLTPFHRQALESLSDAYRLHHRPEKLASMLQAQLVTEHYSVTERVNLWTELGSLYAEHLEDPDRAMTAWESALREQPDAHPANEALHSQYRLSKRWESLVSLLSGRIARMSDDTEALPLLLELAELQGEQLQDWEAAAGTFRTILNAFPEHIGAFSSLEAVYRRRGQWLQLYELWRSSLDRLDDNALLSRLVAMAELVEVELEDPALAFELWKRATDLSPTDMDARAALRRLGLNLNQTGEVVSAHEEQLARLEGQASADLAFYVAQLCLDPLDDIERAITNLELIINEFAPESVRAMTALIACYERTERWAPMADCMERLGPLLERGDALNNHERALARLYDETLGELDRAISTWQRVMALSAPDTETLQALGSLYERTERWGDALESWQSLALIRPDDALQLDVRRAKILEGHLAEPTRAITLLQDILTRQPNHSEALVLLKVLLQDSAQHVELLDYLEAAFDAESDRERKLSYALECASVCGAPLHDSEGMTDWLARALELDPDHQDARRQLVDLYEARGQWEELLSMQRQVAETAGQPRTRADALKAVGDILETEANDVDGAVAAYEAALDLDPTRIDALEKLDALYVADGRSLSLIERLRLALDRTTDEQSRFRLLFRWGQVAGANPQMVPDAFSAYREALKLQPDSIETVDGLLELARKSRREDEILEFLSLKLTLETDPQQQALLHLELSAFWNARADPQRAHEHLEAAHRLTPTARIVTEPFVKSLISKEMWRQAHALLVPLLEAERGDSVGDDAELWELVAQCAEALDDVPGALEACRQAVRVGGEQLDRVETLADLLMRAEEWTEAANRYDQLIQHPDASWTASQRVELALRSSKAATAGGERERAASSLVTLGDDTTLTSADLQRIADELEQMTCWTEAVATRRRLVTITQDAEERSEQLAHIAMILRHEVGDLRTAVDALRQSLEVGGFNHERALELVTIACELEDFAEAIEWLSRGVDHTSDAHAQADLHHRIACHYSDDLRDPAAAAIHLNHELDLVPTRLESFAKLDAILTAHRDWKELERAYRKMLERVLTQGGFEQRGPELPFTLYRNLGEIYRSRLEQPEHALAAYEAAVQYKPDALAIREILVGLYSANDPSHTRLSEHLKRLIIGDPSDFERYRHLFNVLVSRKAADEAWCVAGLLNGLGQASRSEARFYNTYLEPLLPDNPHPLSRDLWARCLETSPIYEALGRLFSVLTSVLSDELAGLEAPSLSGQPLSPQSRTLLATTLGRITALMGVAEPNVNRSTEAGVRLTKSFPPSLMIGADMDAGHSQKELAFLLSKQIALLHPSRAPAVLLSTPQLAQLLAAAMSVRGPDSSPTLPDERFTAEQRLRWQQAVSATWTALDKALSDEERKDIARDIETLTQEGICDDTGGLIRCVQDWQRSTELTANHVALLVCGDISLSLRLLKREVPAQSVVDRDAKLKDVVHYVLSEPFSSARAALNLAIDRGERPSADN